ncbi:Hypothetical protein AJF4211_000360 [Avibacterium paragallinarum JF4211]|nr:Hypothetical protein AJF4211_000360 [Avibacterium paragallinarum JF4211]
MSRLNINVAKGAMFYWVDSHNAFLTYAKRDKARKQYFLNKAAQCRRQAADLVSLIRLARVIH